MQGDVPICCAFAEVLCIELPGRAKSPAQMTLLRNGPCGRGFPCNGIAFDCVWAVRANQCVIWLIQQSPAESCD